MRYESEVLYDLMKRDGLLNPSQDRLPYESELKEKYVDDVKGAYPKLIDYRSEWLNYAYENTIGEFPYETLTNVTEATINNVVPYAYKSAILKGNTSVNLVPPYEGVNTSLYNWDGINMLTELNDTNYKITAQNGNCNIAIRLYTNGEWQTTQPLKLNTTYLAIVDLDVQFSKNMFVGCGEVSYIGIYGKTELTTGRQKAKFKFTTPTEINNQLCIGTGLYYDAGEYATFYSLVIVEYVDGMENWDIPYFEGMQSVKMPVLTTSNEDDTKSNILTVNEPVELRGIGDVQDTLDLMTGELTQRIGRFIEPKDCSVEKSSFKPTDSNIIAFAFNGSSSSLKFKSSKLVQSNDVNKPYSWRNTTGVWYVFRFPKADVPTTSAFKQWLLDNEVLHTLIVPVVKTVDLKVVDHNGNQLSTLKPIEGTMTLRTDGTPIKPTFSGEIPVEAITQNIASFIE